MIGTSKTTTSTLPIEEFPGVEELPRYALGRFPTPVERLARCSEAFGTELWIKRDDLSHLRYGGSKIRKLEWLLGHAQEVGSKVLVVSGHYGSHLAVATGVFAQEAGMSVHAVLSRQPISERIGDQLRAMRAHGVELTTAHSSRTAALKARVALFRATRNHEHPILLPRSGSSARGILGAVNGGLELAQQIDEQRLPEPAEVMCAAASGGLAIGLAIGLAAAGIRCPVRAVRVGPRAPLSKARLSRLLAQTVRQLQAVSPQFPAVAGLAERQLVLEHHFVGRSFGHGLKKAHTAARHARADDIVTEPTYTEKAFAAFLDQARGRPKGPLLFWHSAPGRHQAQALGASLTEQRRDSLAPFI